MTNSNKEIAKQRNLLICRVVDLRLPIIAVLLQYTAL
jgi:hypothetical protein